MTTAAPEIPARKSGRRVLAACGLTFFIAICCALICYLKVGASLGLFLGGIAAIGLFLPYLSDLVATPVMKLLTAPAFTAGIAVIWIIGAMMFGIPSGQVLRSVVVLAAFAVAVVGMPAALVRGTRCNVVPSAITVVLALAWVSWPVWLSPQLPGSESLVTWLVRLHPVFAINGAMPQLGTWTHQPLMYHLTNLGQDVAYVLPTSVWPCAIAHLGVGAVLLALSVTKPDRDDSR